MAKYVLVNRRSGKFTDDAKIASRATVAEALALLPKAAILGQHNPKDPLARRVVVMDVDPESVASIRASLSPDAILEQLITRGLHRWVQPLFASKATPLRPPKSKSSSYTITVTGGGNPLTNIQVMLYLGDPGGNIKTTTVNTDSNGVMKFNLPAGYSVADVEPIPDSSYWIMFEGAPASASTIDCAPIAPSESGKGWWHDVLRVDVNDATRGAGINVGVVDTGCGPHPDLAHVTLVGSFVDGGALPPPTATDVAQHGTHTSGIIGARSVNAADYAGIAAGCNLFHARVFKSEEEGPSQADISNAIDSLSRDHACDLINMSLGGGPASQAEEDTIRDAYERGTLCICSAGNNNGPINFPAAYPECEAVSAIGKIGTVPGGTFSAQNRPQDANKQAAENLFLAAFSCFGPTLACTAPGVGIVSTVPDRNGITGAFMELDGTSMASPAACGVLADILAKDAVYKTLPRDSTRAAHAALLLAQHCRSIGLDVQFEGHGVPAV